MLWQATGALKITTHICAEKLALSSKDSRKGNPYSKKCEPRWNGKQKMNPTGAQTMTKGVDDITGNLEATN